jgi:hypothetical protein
MGMLKRSLQAAGASRPFVRVCLFSSVLLCSGAVLSSERVSTCLPDVAMHGGGLNRCGCHFNRKTGECHCHRPSSCGCSCQPATCR